MDDQVTTYVDELQQKESQLNDLQNELGMLIREKHITEVIRDNKTNKKKIEQALKLVIGECDILRKMVAAPTGKTGILTKIHHVTTVVCLKFRFFTFD